MTGDNEHERQGAGDEPAPESAEESAGGSFASEPAKEAFEEPDTEPLPDVAPAPRRFRAWAAAEEKPSMLSRLRHSIGAIFKEKPKEEPVVEEHPDVAAWRAETDPAASRYDGDSSPDDRPWMDPRVPDSVELKAAHEEEPLIEPVAEGGSDWQEPVVEPDAADSRPMDASHFSGPFFEAPTEIIEETPPPKVGFLGRLFGRKSKAVTLPPVVEEPLAPTNEYGTDGEPTQPAQETGSELSEPQLTDATSSEIDSLFDDQPPSYTAPAASSTDESNFASVDDALPVAEEPPATDFPAFTEPVAPLEPEPDEAKEGFFSRLIGRKSRKSIKKPRSSLEIEIHEDRIAAAADALDQMDAPAAAETPQAPTPAFSSVDEAFPEPVGDARFAPPPESHPTIEAVSDEAVNESRPTLEVARDSRSTVEMTGDAVPASRAAEIPPADFGKTMDIADDDTLDIDKKGKAPKPAEMHMMFGNTIEIADQRRQDADSGAYFGDTLEPSHFGDIAPPLEELDKDTDEFAVPMQTSAETPAPDIPDLDADTAQVSRKSLIQKLLFWRKEQEEKTGPLDGSQTVVEGNPNFLFSKFRTFYNEIIRHKHQKTEFTAGFSTAIVTEYTADLSPEGAADTLSKNLAAMLELQAAEATWMGGESAQRYPDAQYAMAALADETFLHQEWEGKGAWHRHLLEMKLFRSRSADVELFKRIDKLLKDQPNSPAARDLARVYLMVIAAGFKGKYRPFGLSRALAEYRQRLYEYIHQGGDALMLYAPERRIFPEATERTLVGHAIGRYSSAQRWAAILAFLILSYTAIAHIAWSRVSADLRDVTGRIKATSTAASGNGGE